MRRSPAPGRVGERPEPAAATAGGAAAAADPPAGPASTAIPRYGMLLLTAALSIAVQGIAEPGRIQQAFVTVLSGATLLLALRSARLSQRRMRVAAAAALVAVALSVVRAAGGGIGDGAARTMNAALLALGPPAVAIGVMRDLHAVGRVRFEAVLGVLSLYLLLGLLFAFVYGAIEQVSGTPVFAADQTATVSRCIYYSFTTLTTVGYGDVVTRTQLGHTLSIFEALLGQIYLVTIVSLLVSNLAPGRGRRAEP